MRNPKVFKLIFQLQLSSAAILATKPYTKTEGNDSIHLDELASCFVAGGWRVEMVDNKTVITYDYQEEGRRNYVRILSRFPGVLDLGFRGYKPVTHFRQNHLLTRAEKSGVDLIKTNANMTRTEDGWCNVDDGDCRFCLSDGKIVLSRTSIGATYNINANNWVVICLAQNGQRHATMFVRYGYEPEAALNALEARLEEEELETVWDYLDRLNDDFVRALEEDVIWT